nr:hypothetical protein BdHM001_30690 [Bdellovibrio sp. HM001]
MGTSVQHPLCFLGAVDENSPFDCVVGGCPRFDVLGARLRAAGAASALRLGYFDQPFKFVQ